MNSLVLMAEIFSEPELRHTADNQNAIASFLVQFSAQRSEEPPYRLRVTGWNTLAETIMAQYHRGDQVIIEGRLQINTIEKNGAKEKRTELVAQRIHSIHSLGKADLAAPTASDLVMGAPEPQADFDNIPF
ncbi:MAG: single-stranded DNA-binding protein [Pseudanabaenaceae cyanobacterium bins.68]|nr:single-stranded DNA-binding protein [Pseudanabaenaceae cyanobacterium bins.68]